MKLNKILLAVGLLGAGLSSTYAAAAAAAAVNANPTYNFLVYTEIGQKVALVNADKSAIDQSKYWPMTWDGTAVQPATLPLAIQTSDVSKDVLITMTNEADLTNGGSTIPLSVAFAGQALTKGTAVQLAAASIFPGGVAGKGATSGELDLVISPGVMPATPAAGRYNGSLTLSIGLAA